MSWKDGVSKKLDRNMIFLVLSKKRWYLFFSENMILFFRQKNNDLFQKRTWKWYFLQVFWKDSFSKELTLEYDLSSIIRKDYISISRKYDLFFELICSNLLILFQSTFYRNQVCTGMCSWKCWWFYKNASH